MQAKYAKDEDDPSYDNLQSTVCKSKNASKVDNIRLLLKRPVFKWTAVVITTITVLSVMNIVPTILEITKNGKQRENLIPVYFGLKMCTCVRCVENVTTYLYCSHFSLQASCLVLPCSLSMCLSVLLAF